MNGWMGSSGEGGVRMQGRRRRRPRHPSSSSSSLLRGGTTHQHKCKSTHPQLQDLQLGRPDVRHAAAGAVPVLVSGLGRLLALCVRRMANDTTNRSIAASAGLSVDRSNAAVERKRGADPCVDGVKREYGIELSWCWAVRRSSARPKGVDQWETQQQQ